MEPIILDLDASNSIKDLDQNISSKYMGDTIYKLISLVKKFGKYLGIVCKEVGGTDLTQYELSIKYLGNVLPIIFEFDYSFQFINMILYNKDQSKTYLKLFISIVEDPTVKYVENDRSGVVPEYCDEHIKLKPGEYLIHFSHKLISYIGFNKIRLDDDSYLVSNEEGIELRTKLWLYLLMLRGKSWYAKFGYYPINTTDYDMALSDMKNLKLDEISACLKKIIVAPNRRDFIPDLLEISNNLVSIIGDSCETLEEFTRNHSLEEFTNLTNNLTQSIFRKKIFIQLDSDNHEESDDSECDDSESESEHSYCTMEFSWYDKYRRLQLANVMQINTNIQNFYYVPKN